MPSPASSLQIRDAHGSPRYFLDDRRVAGGDVIELCASGGWLTGRFECDAGTGGAPTFFFSVELEGGGVAQLHFPIPERALLRRPATTSEVQEVRRGDLFWIGGAAGGSVPHPHLVVQDDVFNRSRVHTVLVCALTSNTARASEPGNVLLTAGEGGLAKESVVVVSRVSSVERAELGERIGTLSVERVDQVLAGLRFQQASFFGDR